MHTGVSWHIQTQSYEGRDGEVKTLETFGKTKGEGAGPLDPSSWSATGVYWAPNGDELSAYDRCVSSRGDSLGRCLAEYVDKNPLSPLLQCSNVLIML